MSTDDIPQMHLPWDHRGLFAPRDEHMDALPWVETFNARINDFIGSVQHIGLEDLWSFMTDTQKQTLIHFFFVWRTADERMRDKWQESEKLKQVLGTKPPEAS